MLENIMVGVTGVFVVFALSIAAVYLFREEQ